MTKKIAPGSSRAARAPETVLLLGLLDEAYDRKAWHGPNLRGSIRGVSGSVAAWRPARGRHNIRELVVHAAYWKYAVWRQLTRAKLGSFPLRGSNWFLREAEEPWRDDVDLLDAMHRRLRAAVEAFPASRLPLAAGSGRYTAARMIAGVAAHDVYHAGQIRLIKTLRRRTRG